MVAGAFPELSCLGVLAPNKQPFRVSPVSWHELLGLLLLSGPTVTGRTRAVLPEQCYLTLSSMFPAPVGAEFLREEPRKSGFEKYRTEVLQASLFESSLFVRMFPLCIHSLDFQQPSNPHVDSISCCWV